MGLPPSEWEYLTEMQLTSYADIHRHVRSVESEKWDHRIKAILKALGAKVA